MKVPDAWASGKKWGSTCRSRASLQSVKTLWVLAQRLTVTTNSMYQLYRTNDIYESIFD